MTEGNQTDDQGPSLESVVGSLVIAATLILAFALLAAGWEWFWIVFIIGFGGALPTAPTLVAWYESRSGSSSTDEPDPLETLRNRYARGDIDEAEFERRLDALLETESKTGPGPANMTNRDADRLSQTLNTNTDPTDTMPETETDTDTSVERGLDSTRE
ncbi:MAG: putative membrane protein (DUF2078) [halophilic archaeon J07HX5]|nr:MAG: putative membrane protein (DUF2078) [halophilic archaeon J07HX5]